MAAQKTTADKPKRQYAPRRSPEQRAQDDLKKAADAYGKAQQRLQKAQAEVEEASADLARAERYLTYKQQNPDLPEPTADQAVEQNTLEDRATV